MSVINSLLPRIEIPENTSLHAFLDEKFATHPGDKAAAIDVKTGKTVTYSALRKVVRCTAAGLARLGFRAGDLMLVLSHNSTDYVCTFLATWALGGVMSSATLGSSVEDVKRRIEVLLHCGKLKFMAADAASLDVSRQVAEIFDLTVSTLEPPSSLKQNSICMPT